MYMTKGFKQSKELCFCIFTIRNPNAQFYFNNLYRRSHPIFWCQKYEILLQGLNELNKTNIKRKIQIVLEFFACGNFFYNFEKYFF